MRAECNRQQLEDALKFVARGVAGRSTLPILSHIYLEAKADMLHLIGSDLEVWCERWIPATVKEEGKLTAPASLLPDLVRLLEGETIRLEEGERKTLVIEAGNAHYKLLSLPADQYPMPPAVENATRFEVEADKLYEAFDWVAFAVSQEAYRLALTGVRAEYESGRLRLVASDTHRLAFCSLPVKNGGGAAQAIVQPRAFKLLKYLPDSHTCTVQMGTKNFSCSVVRAQIVALNIDAVYPNWQRGIPEKGTTFWVLDVNDFRNALRRLYYLVKKDKSKVILRSERTSLYLTAHGEMGEAVERVELVRDGDDLEIAFNAQFLLDVLDVMEGKVTIELTDSLRAAVFRQSDREDYLCVIMPMTLGR
jgi:DNA polymerase-3 subunit beta